MRKSLALSLLTVFVVSATTGAMAANNAKSSGNPVVNAGKKVGNAVAWPFKKAGEGMKNLGKKKKK